MKKPLLVLLCLGLASAVGALVVSLLGARPGVAMTLVEYRRWPHGALVRLTNSTRTNIRYLAERNDTPAGSPILCLNKTSSGWTNASTLVMSAKAFDPTTGKTREVFFLRDPNVMPEPREQPLLSADLKPGQSVQFFIHLEPDASPKRVGTVCCIQPGKVTKYLQPYLSRIKQWCRIKTATPGQVEVWCPEVLCIASPQQPATGN